MSNARPLWRVRRVRALAVSVHLRELVRAHGRLPNCPPGRLPFDALEAWLSAREVPPFERTVNGCSWGATPDRWISFRCDVSDTTASRWRARNWLSVRDADQAALALGVHPVLIWPEFGDVTDNPLRLSEADW